MSAPSSLLVSQLPIWGALSSTWLHNGSRSNHALYGVCAASPCWNSIACKTRGFGPWCAFLSEAAVNLAFREVSSLMLLLLGASLTTREADTSRCKTSISRRYIGCTMAWLGGTRSRGETMSSHRFRCAIPVGIGVNFSHDWPITFQRTSAWRNPIYWSVKSLYSNWVLLIFIHYKHVTRSISNGDSLCMTLRINSPNRPSPSRHNGRFSWMISFECGSVRCVNLCSILVFLTSRFRPLSLHSLAVRFFWTDALYEFLLWQACICI